MTPAYNTKEGNNMAQDVTQNDDMTEDGSQAPLTIPPIPLHSMVITALPWSHQAQQDTLQCPLSP